MPCLCFFAKTSAEALFFFTLSRGETFRRYSGAAGGGGFTLEVSVHNCRLRRQGMPGSPSRDKRGQDTIWFPVPS